MLSPMILVYISDITEAECIFMCLFTILASPERYLLTLSCPLFLNFHFVFFLRICRYSLYILDSIPLPIICVMNIFAQLAT